MVLEKFEMEDEGWECYGFMVYNRCGYSLPKGMITSMKAQKFSDNTVEIEFHVQSPSGHSPDSSDHLTYTMPTISSFEKGKAVIDLYADIIQCYIYEGASEV
jgi:hypothetical protein